MQAQLRGGLGKGGQVIDVDAGLRGQPQLRHGVLVDPGLRLEDADLVGQGDRVVEGKHRGGADAVLEVPGVGVGEQADAVGGLEPPDQLQGAVDGGEEVRKDGQELRLGQVSAADGRDAGEEGLRVDAPRLVVLAQGCVVIDGLLQGFTGAARDPGQARQDAVVVEAVLDIAEVEDDGLDGRRFGVAGQEGDIVLVGPGDVLQVPVLEEVQGLAEQAGICLLYTSPSPRD